MKKVILVMTVLALLTLSIAALADTTVYSNNFEGSIGTEWSSTQTDVTPFGARKFLGQFHNDSISLTLNNLPSHYKTKVSLDLFVIRTWDGNLTADPGFPGKFIGPDIWSLNVVGGQTLINATFNNHDFYSGWTQSYPDAYPGGSYVPRTGATENNTLGFAWDGYEVIDSVYHLSFEFNHSDENLSLIFAANTVDFIYPQYDPDTESWGLDNVQVSVSVVPEPGSLLALGSGFVGLVGFVIRKRK